MSVLLAKHQVKRSKDCNVINNSGWNRRFDPSGNPYRWQMVRFSSWFGTEGRLQDDTFKLNGTHISGHHAVGFGRTGRNIFALPYFIYCHSCRDPLTWENRFGPHGTLSLFATRLGPAGYLKLYLFPGLANSQCRKSAHLVT